MPEVDANSTLSPARPRRRSIGLALFALLALALIGLSWLDSRNRIGATQEELARRLRDIEAESRDARSISRQTQEVAREVTSKLTLMESRLSESQSQQVALEALYQELSRNRDEWQLAEIEQVLAIASQQLQLSGNVRAAMLALQLAEARLARADRPQFLPVRRALARDIERLKALPALDIPGMGLKIDGLIASVDGLPLANDERISRLPALQERGAKRAEAKKPEAKAEVEAVERGFIVRFGAELWHELRQLVSIRRVDAPDPPLLSPAQSYFLRENLKLRLLSAKLNLLTRDEGGYREDLRTAQQWVQKYFDARAKASLAALAQMRQLSAASISLEMPSISESLEAIRNFKAPRQRRPG